MKKIVTEVEHVHHINGNVRFEILNYKAVDIITEIEDFEFHHNGVTMIRTCKSRVVTIKENQAFLWLNSYDRVETKKASIEWIPNQFYTVKIGIATLDNGGYVKVKTLDDNYEWKELKVEM